MAERFGSGPSYSRLQNHLTQKDSVPPGFLFRIIKTTEVGASVVFPSKLKKTPSNYQEKTP